MASRSLVGVVVATLLLASLPALAQMGVPAWWTQMLSEYPDRPSCRPGDGAAQPLDGAYSCGLSRPRCSIGDEERCAASGEARYGQSEDRLAGIVGQIAKTGSPGPIPGEYNVVYHDARVAGNTGYILKHATFKDKKTVVVQAYGDRRAFLDRYHNKRKPHRLADSLVCGGGELEVLTEALRILGIAGKVDPATVGCASFRGETTSYPNVTPDYRVVYIWGGVPLAAPTKPEPVRSSCDPAVLAGRWTNPGKEYAGFGVSLKVTAQGGRVSGEFDRTLRRKPTDSRPDWPWQMLRSFEIAKPAYNNGQGGVCRHEATGYIYSTGTSSPWRGVVSWKADGTGLRIEDRSESAPWTRGEPPAPAQTCSDGDIEGTWHRPDGARLSVRGMNFKDGGAGVWEAYPDPRWRPGAYRYQSIKPAGACRWTATCVAVSIDSAGGGWQERSGACTLTVDPKTGRLTDSGSNTTGSYTYSREPAEGSREAQDLNAEVNRKNAEAEAREKAREAEYERKMREYEAKKKADADAYARAQQEYERQKAEVEAKRQRELREWQERVRRCQEGDITACAQP